MKFTHKQFYFCETTLDNISVEKCQFINGPLPIIWYHKRQYGYIPVKIVEERFLNLKRSTDETMFGWDMTIPILNTITELFQYAG